MMQLGHVPCAQRVGGEKAAAFPKALGSGAPAPQKSAGQGQRSTKVARANFSKRQGEKFQLRALGSAERTPVGAEVTSKPLNIAFVSAEVSTRGIPIVGDCQSRAGFCCTRSHEQQCANSTFRLTLYSGLRVDLQMQSTAGAMKRTV